tara:strand:+ start:154 stop:300 length:147 start_codon:yes stop_codon:yes gene_type:complete
MVTINTKIIKIVMKKIICITINKLEKIHSQKILINKDFKTAKEKISLS